MNNKIKIIDPQTAIWVLSDEDLSKYGINSNVFLSVLYGAQKNPEVLNRVKTAVEDIVQTIITEVFPDTSACYHGLVYEDNKKPVIKVIYEDIDLSEDYLDELEELYGEINSSSAIELNDYSTINDFDETEDDKDNFIVFSFDKLEHISDFISDYGKAYLQTAQDIALSTIFKYEEGYYLALTGKGPSFSQLCTKALNYADREVFAFVPEYLSHLDEMNKDNIIIKDNAIQILSGL